MVNKKDGEFLLTDGSVKEALQQVEKPLFI